MTNPTNFTIDDRQLLEYALHLLGTKREALRAKYTKHYELASAVVVDRRTVVSSKTRPDGSQREQHDVVWVTPHAQLLTTQYGRIKRVELRVVGKQQPQVRIKRRKTLQKP